MNAVYVVCIVLALACCALAQQQTSFDLPQPQTYNDPQSALNVKSNLQSPQYQDFIQTLYRFDQDSLNRVNNLFETSAPPQQPDASYSSSQRQPTYADYIRSQEQQQQQQQQQQPDQLSYAGKRFKREANIVRPLFVYRIFQEIANKRKDDRAIRRLYKYRKPHKNHVRQ